MRELKPLTIANSLKSGPSVLLTPELEKFTFVQPLSQELLITQNIYKLIYKHFKVELLETGTFKVKGVKYLCAEEPDGLLEVNKWLDCLWANKRQFNHLLNPEALFKMYLINLFFPIFSNTKKLILPGKKDRFIMDAYPDLNNHPIRFKPVNLNGLGLARAEFIKLFSYISSELSQVLDDFLILHHDNLYKDLKYQVSLYPSLRNKYWDELKKCFNPEFRTFARAEASHYLLKL